MIRRLSGVLLAAAMAHSALAPRDPVCAPHGGHSMSREAPASMPGMHHSGEPEQTGKRPCKAPVRSDCCEAMATCTANAALASGVDDASRLHLGEAAVAFVADAPATRLMPPDPPPPKA